MSVKRVLKWLGLTVAVVLLGAVLYLTFGDLTWVGDKVETMVAENTGRQLDFGGQFELEALWSPSIVAANVTFANADWGTEPQLAEIGHFSAKVDLWSLLSGPILVQDVRLRDVRVLLETNEDGVSNLEMAGSEPEEEEPEPEEKLATDAEVPLVIEFAEIRNLELIMRSPEAEDRVVTVEALDLAANDDLHLALAGNGMLNEHAWQLGGTIGPLGAVKRGDDVHLALEGGLGNLEIGIEGYLATMKELRGSELDIRVSSEDVVPLLETLQVPLAVTGPLRIESTLMAQDDASTLVADIMLGNIAAQASADMTPGEIDFEATLDDLAKIGSAIEMEGLPDSPVSLAGGISLSEETIELRDVSVRIAEFRANVSGMVGKTPGALTEVTASASGPTLTNVSPDLPDIPFSVEAGVVRSASHMKLEPFVATIGDSEVTASLEIQQGDVMSVTGRLSSESIDLSPFVPEPEEPTGEAGQLEEFEEGDEPWEEEETSEFVFTEDPLPLDKLGKYLVDIDLNVGEFIAGPLTVTNLRAKVELTEAGASFDGGFSSIIGGEIDADVSVTGTDGVAQLSAEVYARSLRPNLSSEGLEDPMLVPPLDITVELEAAGGTARAMAESADGIILVTMSKGLVGTSALGFFSGDLLGEILGALNPFAKDDLYSEQDCAIFAIEMENGVADISEMYIQGEKVTIKGEGRVDLATEKLKLEFNTKPRQGLGISADMFVTPFVKLGGTLASPRIGLSKSGALLTGGAAVLTGGLSILVKGAADRLTGGMDQCEARLEDTGGHPPIPGTADPEPPPAD